MKHLDILRLIEAVARIGSIRKTAEDLSLTASALNRRILAFEKELGAPVFERLPRGVRLNPAGELMVHHYRSVTADLARVQSHVAELEGMRRGHVRIACSQALIPFFLPRMIGRFRARNLGVTFGVQVRDRVAAERDLARFESDLALVFEPAHMVDFEVLAAAPQPVCAMMARGHPLAAETGPVRLRDCLAHRHILPTEEYGVRHLIDQATQRASLRPAPALESGSFEFMRRYVLAEPVVGFQIAVGLDPADPEIAVRPVAHRDLPPGRLLLGQMRGRTLPGPAARFGVMLAEALGAGETAV
jgi:DNA-binding transcriptional LysR family regulator